MKWIITAFLLWRVLLFLPLLVGEMVLPFNQNMDYTRIWKFTPPYFPVESVLLYPWANFDGVHYLAIAGEGYSENGRFFPFYPLLINLLSQLLGGNGTYGAVHFFVGFFLSNFLLLLGLFVLKKLIELDYKTGQAKRSILFLLLFPTSFFFISLYTESLFLLLSLLSIYFARSKLWYLAAISGMLLSATRLVGIFILPALLVEFYIQNKELVKKREYLSLLSKNFVLLIIPLGLLSFMFYSRMRFDDELNFIHAQGEVFNNRSVTTIVTPFQTLFRYFKIIFNLPITQYEWWIALLELVSTVFAGILLVVGWKQRVRLSYLVFALLCFILPILSGTLSGMPRYVLILFPIFVSLGLLNNRRWLWIYAAICIPLLFLLTLLFSKGYFVA